MSDLRINNHQFAQAQERLAQFVAIPSVSNPSSPYYKMEHLIAASEFAGKSLQDLGFEVSYVRIDQCAPYVIAQRIINKDLPTVTLYGHYDVQPVDPPKWVSDPFVVQERDGRIYGRGASDDKGGIIAILSALRVYKDANIPLPVNVRVLFEGEEEYGSSPHMGPLLKQEGERIKGAALIIMDGLNRDVETGTLASSARGNVQINLRVDALEKPVHSGIGCLAPDPAQALAKLISSLADPRKIPGLMDGIEPIDPAERKLLKMGSYPADRYAKEMGLVPGASLRGDPKVSLYERISEEPSISILNMNSGQPGGGNSIQNSASCEIGIRILPGQDPDRVAKAVIDYLNSQKVPYHLPIHASQERRSWGWKATPSLLFSQAYLQSLSKHFKEGVLMPCGGSLPLLHEFGKVFPKMEIIVPGVEDPSTAAHSHNESQDIPLLRKSIDSLIAFLAKAGKIKAY